MSEPGIEQENGTPESTVEVVPRSLSFWDGWKRRLLIVFCIHLILVFLFSCGVLYALTHELASDAQDVWLLFLFIDSPIGFLAFPCYFVVELIQGKMDRGDMLFGFPVVFQLLGTINWFLLVSILRTYARRSEKGRVSVILGTLSLFFVIVPYIVLVLGIVGLIFGCRSKSKPGIILNATALLVSLLGYLLIFIIVWIALTYGIIEHL
ncbi:MAG: hypothetical protein ACRC10_04545 [Thermoguttaceae bacterium]